MSTTLLVIGFYIQFTLQSLNLFYSLFIKFFRDVSYILETPLNFYTFYAH